MSGIFIQNIFFIIDRISLEDSFRAAEHSSIYKSWVARIMRGNWVVNWAYDRMQQACVRVSCDRRCNESSSVARRSLFVNLGFFAQWRDVLTRRLPYDSNRWLNHARLHNVGVCPVSRHYVQNWQQKLVDHHRTNARGFICDGFRFTSRQLKQMKMKNSRRKIIFLSANQRSQQNQYGSEKKVHDASLAFTRLNCKPTKVLKASHII